MSRFSTRSALFMPEYQQISASTPALPTASLASPLNLLSDGRLPETRRTGFAGSSGGRIAPSRMRRLVRINE